MEKRDNQFERRPITEKLEREQTRKIARARVAIKTGRYQVDFDRLADTVKLDESDVEGEPAESMVQRDAR